MSKSLRRVARALAEAGIDAAPVEMGETRTAQQAADAVGCALDQIVKSIVFALPDGALPDGALPDGALPDGAVALFLTAGGNVVDAAQAGALAGAPLARADGALVRRATGFAIGGVAPVGHLTPGPVWMDPRLMAFDMVWAAAGTPRHVFPIAPADLRRVSGATLAEFASPA
jgi:prolyl-tRNA editing enzyme YbaK/EbsC (Cys-tRNA(Pro) deacylase)